MSKKVYIGIDNGLDGALCAICDNTIISKCVMPTIPISKSKRDYDIFRIVQFIKQFHEPVVIIEKAQALPGPGNVQMFSLGRGYGIMIGIVSALGYPHHIVHPKTWQSKMFKDVDKSDTKKASVYVAKRLFPINDFRATEKSKNDHHGLTDATLLAYYGQSTEKEM